MKAVFLPSSSGINDLLLTPFTERHSPTVNLPVSGQVRSHSNLGPQTGYPTVFRCSLVHFK